MSEPVEAAEPAARRRSWAIDTTPLRNPAYRRLFWGVAATMLGQQMTLVAVPFQVYALTRDSLLVGVTSIVALVPLIVFGLLGGAIADSMDRRRLMLITSVGVHLASMLDGKRTDLRLNAINVTDPRVLAGVQSVSTNARDVIGRGGTLIAGSAPTYYVGSGAAVMATISRGL